MKPTFRHEVAAWSLSALALIFVVLAHLLPALVAGLLVHELVQLVAPRLPLLRISDRRARMVAVALIVFGVVALLTAATIGLMEFFRGEIGNVSSLMGRMADIIESSRATLPAWLMDHLPADPEQLRQTVTDWLRTHAAELQLAGKEAGRALAHVLIGLVIGALVSVGSAREHRTLGPLAQALTERTTRLARAFRNIVFAQVRISAINTFFTWLYLGVALPAMGIHLPLVKTLLAITFVVGLIPVLGNLISNTVIVVFSFSHSLGVAGASLAFLVIIHKLEYFLNARIVGGQIQARAWELLVAMTAMEAAFGVAGVIAAPVYYAYLKDELGSRKQI